MELCCLDLKDSEKKILNQFANVKPITIGSWRFSSKHDVTDSIPAGLAAIIISVSVQVDVIKGSLGFIVDCGIYCFNSIETHTWIGFLCSFKASGKVG